MICAAKAPRENFHACRNPAYSVYQRIETFTSRQRAVRSVKMLQFRTNAPNAILQEWRSKTENNPALFAVREDRIDFLYG